jgi:hypothetical protein
MSVTAPASRVPSPALAPVTAILLAAALVLSAPLVLPAAPAFAADWPKISEEDRKLASVDPAGPAAILLFEEAEVDDRNPAGRLQSLYRRFKILLPAGTSWATFVVSLDEPVERLVDVDGRTVTAEGREIPLNRSDVTRGTGPGGRTELTFHLPAAAAGCVVEYRYAVLGGSAPSVGGWIFQHEIPCRRSSYVWHPDLGRTSRWVLLNAEAFQPLVEPVFRASSPDSLEAARFEIKDLPAVPDEPWGPPPLEMRARVVTLYDPANLDARDYWRSFAFAARTRELEFASESERLHRELAALDLPDSNTGELVRRVYEWTQGRIVNSATDGGAAPPVPDSVDSLLSAGRGGPDALNMLFIAALADRGISATRAFTVDRDRAFFHPDVLSPAQFQRSLVAVTPTAERVWFFAPGVPFAPPGLLPWYSQGVTAMAAADSGAMFVPTPIDPAEVNRTIRTARVTLDGDGGLQGDVHLDLSGQPELEARQTLAAAGPKALIEMIAEAWRPAMPSVRLSSLRTANESDPTRNLSVDVALEARGVGRRVDAELLVNAAMVARLDRNPLGDGGLRRRQPIFLRWPEVSEDHVTIALPRDWAVATLPEAVRFRNEYGAYEAMWLYDGVSLVYHRTLRLSAARVDPAQEPAFRRLLDEAVRGDSRLVALAYRPVAPSKR